MAFNLLEHIKKVKTPKFLRGVAGQYLFKKEPDYGKPMTFNVGEGMTQAQTRVAERKLKGMEAPAEPSIMTRPLSDLIKRGVTKKIEKEKELSAIKERSPRKYRLIMSPNPVKKKAVKEGLITQKESDLFGVEISPGFTGMVEKNIEKKAVPEITKKAKPIVTRLKDLFIKKAKIAPKIPKKPIAKESGVKQTVNIESIKLHPREFQKAQAEGKSFEEFADEEFRLSKPDVYLHATTRDNMKLIEKEGFKTGIGDRSQGMTKGNGVWLYSEPKDVMRFKNSDIFNGKETGLIDVKVTGKIAKVDNVLKVSSDPNLIKKLRGEGYIGIEGNETVFPKTGLPIKTQATFIFKLDKIKTKSQLKELWDKGVKEVITPAQKIITALKEAKPLRGEQEALYTKARGIKFTKALSVGKTTAGEKGFYAELGQLKGKIKKVEFESIRNKIGQKDIDDLFNQIKQTDSLNYLETIPARQGLLKLLEGQVPTKGEISLLKNVFGKDFSNALLSKRTLFEKIKEAGFQLANIPRSIMASYDLSAPLRQGVFFVGKPKIFFSAFKAQFKALKSEKAFKALNDDIVKRSTYKLMRENNLALTDLGKSLTNREEAFMSSWAEKIPIVGWGVRASSRAYVGFLNKMRADVFDDFVKKGAELGLNKNPRYLKDAANFVNTATGRGSLGALEKAAVPLNSIFFSPRLTMSRLNLINPLYYVKLEPTVRKEALKSLFTFGAIATTVAGLMKMGGAVVVTDPKNADFAKPKFRNTRYDILGGFQQPIRLAAQFLSGKIVSSTTGKTITLGEGYKPLTRLDIVQRFLEYKTSPVASFALALLKGKTAIGEKVDIPTEIINRFIPMVAQDMYELFQEEGMKGLLASSPSIFGVGVMTYGGAESYGLRGKEYKGLNSELNRLKTSMGFPSTQAFGKELTNKEYKELKEKSGKVIAGILKEMMNEPTYKDMPDFEKVRLIKKVVDEVKSKLKESLFPDKKILNELKKRLVKRGVDEEKADKIAEEIYQKEFIEKKRAE